LLLNDLDSEENSLDHFGVGTLSHGCYADVQTELAQGLVYLVQAYRSI